MAGFRQLVRRLVRQAGRSKQDFAHDIGVSPSALSRYLSGSAVPDIATCLLLARTTGTHPRTILRSAGHVAAAELIESQYSTTRRPAASTAEAAFLARWRALSPARQRRLRALILEASRRR